MDIIVVRVAHDRGGKVDKMTHAVITNEEIVLASTTDEAGKIVSNLLLGARGMKRLEVVTFDETKLQLSLLEQLLFEAERNTVYLRANRKIMSQADITSMSSNIRQLLTEAERRIEEVK